MKYKTAFAAVCERYRNPRTRSHAAALLERYASPTRPVTAWHALGEDAEAARLLLATLGFREGEHFTVQTSVLDPDARRVSWTDAGLKLVMAFPKELAGTDFAEVQRRVLLPSLKADPSEPLRDVDSGSGAPASVGPSFGDRVLEATLGVAKRVKAAMACEDAVAAVAAQDSAAASVADIWADRQLLQEDRCDDMPMPVAPLCVLETLARMEGAEGLPAFRVFDSYGDAGIVGRTGWQGSRLVTDDETVPSGRINAMPLPEQKASGAPLDGYLAWTRNDWKKFDGNRGRTVWTQFNAKVVPATDALDFALDAEAMRQFVLAILEHGYGRAFRCALSDTTRLAIGNTGVVEASDPNAEDEDGDPTPFGHRVDDSSMPVRTPVYMGAHVMTEHALAEGLAAEWAPPTHPVRVTDEPTEDDAGDKGLKAVEAAEEWFFVVHGGPVYAPAGSDGPWREHRDRVETRLRNLPLYRASALAFMKSTEKTLRMCSPDNERFSRDADGGYSPEGAFVNGICAAMRKFSGGGLKFVSGTPYFPDRIVAGVWSGLSTDLGPGTPEEAREADAFPRVTSHGFCQDEFGHLGNRAETEGATAFVDLMREMPSVQFRFGKRTKGTHRPHVIVLETNVDAKAFLEALAETGNIPEFVRAGWRAFYTSFLMRNAAPLASVDREFSSYKVESSEIYGFFQFASRAVPDWAEQVALREFPLDVPAGFDFGWREDKYGRLLIVMQTTVAKFALRAKLAYRYAEALPLPTAAYLASHGQAGTVVVAGLDPDQRYRAILRAAVLQPGFDRGDRGVTCGARGRFGYIWYSDELYDMDTDEVPGRSWYFGEPDGVPATEAVTAYVRP